MSKKKIAKKASKKTSKKVKKSKKVANKKLTIKNKAKKPKAKKKAKNYIEDSWDNPSSWAELKNRKIDYAVLNFEGGGDDGCIFDCEFHTNGKVKKVEYFSSQDPFIKSLGDPIWDRYGGFNWFDHCSGSLTWNVANNTIEWKGDHDPESDY